MKTTRLYTVADACRMMGWAADSKYYQRVHGACGWGMAGDVVRINRGFVLTKHNIRRLLAYLKRRWPNDPPPNVELQDVVVGV
jgi:hypothetical protein